MKKQTKVKFLIEAEHHPDFNPAVFAFFPEEHFTHSKTDGLFTCYAHLGQHSSCHIDYANECKEADYFEAIPLIQELIGQGYKDLQILNDWEFTYKREPTQFEVKRGYGATHYRDFKIGEIGIKKNGILKDWFKADDGLRYYTN